MRMQGNLGFISEMVKRAVNGGGGSIYVRAGYTAPVTTAVAAKPVATSAPTANTYAPAPLRPGGPGTPGGGITATHLLPKPPVTPAPAKLAPPILRVAPTGSVAASGGGGAAGEDEMEVATAPAKAGLPFIPLSLLAWALFS